jgi:hypothetical protein
MVIDCECRSDFDEPCTACAQENLERGVEAAMLRAELEMDLEEVY